MTTRTGRTKLQEQNVALLGKVAAAMVEHQFAWVATEEGAILDSSQPVVRKFGDGHLPVDPGVLEQLNRETLRAGKAGMVTAIGDDIWKLHQVAIKHDGVVYLAGWAEVVA